MKPRAKDIVESDVFGNGIINSVSRGFAYVKFDHDYATRSFTPIQVSTLVDTGRKQRSTKLTRRGYPMVRVWREEF